jgi:hypothetical protein
MAVTMKNSVFWDVAPCTSCVNRRFGGTYRLHLQDKKIRERGKQGEQVSAAGSSLADFSSLKMEAILSSETSVHIPENGILHKRELLAKLTPRSWVLEKPPVTQLLKNFPICYGTRTFITVFTSALHSPLS